MRWVFYALLVLNALFFGWYQFVDRQVDMAASGAAVSKVTAVPIKLLSEIVMSDDVVLEKKSAQQLCDVYGPFFLASESKSFLGLVKEAGIKGRQERELVKLKPYYWVYMSPQTSLHRAQELVNRLRGFQLNAEIITEGGLENGVALGHFESKEQVDKLRQRLITLDMPLKMKEKSRDFQQFWVLLEPGSEARIGAELRDKLIADYPDIFHQQKDCKPVASAT